MICLEGKDFRMKRVINTEKAPSAIGPYSQAIMAGNTVFTSGQIPVNPATGEVPEGIEAQAVQALENLKHVLDAAGCSMADVVKTTVFIKDMGSFPVINKIYSTYFVEPFPARSCVEVAQLPKGVLIEIEAVAVKA